MVARDRASGATLGRNARAAFEAFFLSNLFVQPVYNRMRSRLDFAHATLARLRLTGFPFTLRFNDIEVDANSGFRRIGDEGDPRQQWEAPGEFVRWARSTRIRLAGGLGDGAFALARVDALGRDVALLGARRLALFATFRCRALRGGALRGGAPRSGALQFTRGCHLCGRFNARVDRLGL